MRAPALGIAVHLTLAAVTLAGVTMAAVAIGVGSRNVPVAFYSYAVPAAAVALTALVMRAWWRRRWPFDADAEPRREVWRLLAAAIAGGGSGAYAGLLTDWVYDAALNIIWFTLLPLAVVACCGDGMRRSLLRLVAVHVGAEIGAQMGYGTVFGISWVVTRNHLPYVPASISGVLLCELVVRSLRKRGALTRKPREVNESAPRRAR